MHIYVVGYGDSVDSIAASYGITAAEIIYVNQLVWPWRLAVGQALLLPGGMDDDLERRDFWAFGYAYPFIDREVLADSLPYLSGVAVFSYGFSASGELVAPEGPEELETELVAAVAGAGVRPILTLTPFGPDGNFNNYLISALLGDEAAKQRLYAELAAVMGAKGYRGIDVDFEYILPSDRDRFSSFVAELAEVMHRQGWSVSVALAPKTYAGQPGLLYEGMDYAALGAAADSVLLMTYEWGYTYSEPMPIAPLNWVRQVVEYALTEIPAAKIDLGIPNYAYDWTLPYVKGESKARTLGGVEAMRQAAEVGAQIMYDEAAQAPYYNYRLDGVEHEVWFEDARSIGAKLALIREYGLRGGGWWQLMRLFRAGWLELAAEFNILK